MLFLSIFLIRVYIKLFFFNFVALTLSQNNRLEVYWDDYFGTILISEATAFLTRVKMHFLSKKYFKMGRWSYKRWPNLHEICRHSYTLIMLDSINFILNDEKNSEISKLNIRFWMLILNFTGGQTAFNYLHKSLCNLHTSNG